MVYLEMKTKDYTWEKFCELMADETHLETSCRSEVGGTHYK